MSIPYQTMQFGLEKPPIFLLDLDEEELGELNDIEEDDETWYLIF